MSNPDQIRLYRRPLALMLAEHPRTVPEALELAQADYAARPDQGSLAVLALTLFRSGRGGEALDAARRAVEWGVPEPQTLYWAGEAALGAGDITLGTRLLERALAGESELGPVTTEKIQQLLARSD